jgi:hypothetical protein
VARRTTTAPVLTQRALNRALLARQLLLERAPLSIPEAIEQVAPLQTQYAPSGYVGLWTRLTGFRRDALTRALEDRSVIQASLLRTTIHLVSRREYWRYEAAIREARRAWHLRLMRERGITEAQLRTSAARLAEALADGPKTIKELDGLVHGFIGNASIWLDLVRVPPSGTWERRRADRIALAEAWVGPDDATEAEGLAQVVRGYLRAFGPAPWKDIAAWAGISLSDAKRGGEDLTLVRFQDDAGRELIDLPDQPLPDPDTPAPVRLLPHWDAVLLVHARRTGVLAEAYRPRIFTSKNPFSVGTVLVDGRVVAAWSLRDGRVVLDPYEDLAGADARAVEREREALEAFHA